MVFKKNKNIEPPSPTKKKIIVNIGEENSEEFNLEELNNLQINKEDLRRLTKKKNKVKGGTKDIEYTLYTTSKYGQIANSLFETLSDYFIGKFPFQYKNFKSTLLKSDIKILSRTYLSMVFFSGSLASTIVLLVTLIISFFSQVSMLIAFSRAIGLSILSGALISLVVYFYPYMIISGRNKQINNDLPFVIIHMAAVSGSGAQPISIFNLVLNSRDYKGLEKEIRKIVNYVNLFGYDLTTALRNVAATTPNQRFRELLTGIVATLETGGDLKDYLKGKADEALTTYKLERKKHVSQISTFSDIYISILIAAPLLFIVTLAIINILGGKICLGGNLCMEAASIAFVGTFFIIPLLNLVFMIILNITQSGE